ncbi:MAG: 50S ribosomal protein L6 [bacterium]|nr:50S ribosomal protein L6 [bacterium]
MSRIGNKPIEIPAGVELTVEGTAVAVKGPKGALKREFPLIVSIEKEGTVVRVSPRNKEDTTKAARAMWGTARQLIANMIQGVEKGYEKKLEIEGVGYRAAVQGDVLNLEVGYTNPTNLKIPEGLAVLVEKNIISVSGIDKEVVGQFASHVRSAREAEPYKGKGIKYVGEQIRRKLGKRAAATAGGAK